MNAAVLDSKEYHSYYEPYIKSIGNIDLLFGLESGLSTMTSLIENLPKEKLKYSYAIGKWTVAEVLQHLIDAERVFQYRALRFARNDGTELQGFDQDTYVPESRANERTKREMSDDFLAVRNSTISLFGSFNREELLRRGSANGAEMSVRALGFVICGHQAHHLKILEERYKG